MRRKRRSRAEWEEICREYQASDKPAAIFAQRRGLSRSTLLWWNSRLRRGETPLQAENRFVEVVAEEVPKSAHSVVRIGGVVVELSEGLPPADWIAKLVSQC